MVVKVLTLVPGAWQTQSGSLEKDHAKALHEVN